MTDERPPFNPPRITKTRKPLATLTVHHRPPLPAKVAEVLATQLATLADRYRNGAARTGQIRIDAESV